jgi:uncharacterized membrane protein YphA (DoxX/SURF4 family)
LIARLADLLQTLLPVADALLRIAVGLALVPHGLRNTFGFFPDTGVRALSLPALSAQLDAGGYRPGWFWAPAISLTQLVGGPLLALGLLTRPVAAVVLAFLIVANVERWRVGKYADVERRRLLGAYPRRRPLFARPPDRLGAVARGALYEDQCQEGFFAAWGMIPKSGGRFFGKIIHNKQSAP